jgi:hypothetical protein
VYKYLSVTVIIAQFFIFGCGPKKDKASDQLPANPVVMKQEIQKVEFIPPADSSITESQMKYWLICNPLLDSIAFMYADSFKTADPQKRMQFQNDFIAGQDKICVLSGLTGGYKEYKWIMENMGNPKNKTIAEAAGAKSF